MSRHNRKFDPHPDKTANGKRAFEAFLSVAPGRSDSDVDVADALYYADAVLTLPTGGIALKRKLRAEAVRRGLL